MVSCQLDTTQIHLGRGCLTWGIARVRFVYDLICLKDQLVTDVEEPFTCWVLVVNSMQPKVTREEGVSTEGFAQVSLACGLACERVMIGVEGTSPLRVAPALDRWFWAFKETSEQVWGRKSQ